MLETVFYSLRLFVVGGERIAMAMAVQNIMVIHNYSNKLPEAICVAMATCNFVGKYIKLHFLSVRSHLTSKRLAVLYFP